MTNEERDTIIEDAAEDAEMSGWVWQEVPEISAIFLSAAAAIRALKEQEPTT